MHLLPDQKEAICTTSVFFTITFRVHREATCIKIINLVDFGIGN